VGNRVRKLDLTGNTARHEPGHLATYLGTVATRKAALEDFPKVDAAWLKANGYLNLEPGTSMRLGWLVDGELGGFVEVWNTDAGIDITWPKPYHNRAVSISLTKADQTFGSRTYFICPKCEERRAHLYLFGHDAVCGPCTGLRHLRAVLSKADRLQDELHEARRSLFMDDAGHFHRPRGMHDVTWIRRIQRWEAAANAVTDEVARTLDTMA